MMENAKPCPFCGSQVLSLRNTDGVKWGAVHCEHCGVQGPEVRTNYEPSSDVWGVAAIEEWNRRAQL
jgi:Lar family restriction alleviation protein